MKRKKGFTLVELIIVIAIIAIISAVLIPTFTSVIARANKAADIQLVKNLNTLLSLDINQDLKDHSTMFDALKTAESAGISVDEVKNNKTRNHIIAWDSQLDRFVLIDTINDKCVYPSTNNNNDEQGIITLKYQYFAIYDEMPTEQTYSIYATDSLTGDNGEVNLTVGFDQGSNVRINSLIYDRSTADSSRQVIIRTNNGTTCEFNGYDGGDESDTIYHYGESGNQTISVGQHSFCEYGAATEVEVKKGHYVQENGSIVAVVNASATNSDVVVDLKSGSIQGTVKNTNTEHIVTINGESGVITINFVGNTEGGDLIVNLSSKPTYTNKTDMQQEADEENPAIKLSGLGAEESAIPSYDDVGEDNAECISVAGYSIKVYTNCNAYSHSETMVDENIVKENTYTIKFDENGDSIKFNSSDDHIHTFGGPSWTWDGYQTATATFVCTANDCNYTEKIVVPTKAGNITKVTKIATCNETGENTYTAHLSHHNEQFESVSPNKEIIAIDENAHSWGDWEITTQPTCSQKGVETRTCKHNHSHTETRDVGALGHDLVHHDAQAATCTEIGWEAYDTCSRCEYTTYVEIPALGHDHVHHDAKASTCTEAGWNAYDTCSRCDYTTKVEIPALEHAIVHHDAQAATCTEIGWNAYDTCSRCDYTTYEEISALGHNLVHHDAKASTCTEIGWNAYDTCSRCDYTTYEEVSALGHDWDNNGICKRCYISSISIKLANIDKYLYRVGNKDDVPISALFNGTVSTLTIDTIQGNASGNKNGDNITFSNTGTGVVKVTANNSVELLLEVVDAYNVTSYGQLQNRNSVLLNDITMSDGGKYNLSNATLFGNGFTFDVTNAEHQNSKGTLSYNYVILLNNSNLDNIKIIGKVYTSYGGQTSNDWNYPCILINSGDCVIANSYISNCASPVRITNAKVTFENTTLKGGTFCNLDVRPNSNVTINGLTTINQVSSNDAASNGKQYVGLGIVVYYESITGSESIEIINDSLAQYNWLASNQSSYAVDFAKDVYNNMFSIDNKYVYTDSNSVKWVNTGILSLSSLVGSDNITTQTGYSWKSVSLLSHSGFLCSTNASAPIDAPEFVSSEQHNHIPKFTINKQGDNYSNGKLIISFGKGETYPWDADKVSASANSKNIPVTITTDASYNQNTNEVSFTESGDYTITCSYIVTDNYRLNNGEIEKYSREYITTIPVVVSVTAKKPTISFNGFTTTEYEIENKTYLLVTDATTTVDNIGTVTETINGVATNIKYPIIEFTGKYSGTIYWPIFGDIVKIDDDGTSYGSATKTKPDNLTLYWGKYYGKAGSTLYNEAKGGKPGSDVYKDVFAMARGGAATVQIDTNNNKAVYSQSVDNSNRKDWTFVVKYCYQSGGYTFYYYIGYKESSSVSGGGGGCLLPSTLITLADGTQKAVEMLTGDEMLLVWNLEKGSYDSAPIFCIDHKDLPEQEYTVNKIKFSNGSFVEIVGEQGFFDMELAKYVYIDYGNHEQYLGHHFVTYSNTGTFETTTLVGVEEYQKITKIYSPVTYGHFVQYANGILTMPGELSGYFNYFEVDTNTLSYNQEKKTQDIETYGLVTFEEYAIIPEYTFYAFNTQYVKIALGKGLLIWEENLARIEHYMQFIR